MMVYESHSTKNKLFIVLFPSMERTISTMISSSTFNKVFVPFHK